MMGGSGINLAPVQTDNHASTSSLNILQVRCFSWCLTNSVKALKAVTLRTRNNNNITKVTEN